MFCSLPSFFSFVYLFRVFLSCFIYFCHYLCLSLFPPPARGSTIWLCLYPFSGGYNFEKSLQNPVSCFLDPHLFFDPVLSFGFYSYIISLQKPLLPRSFSAILPRVALVVCFVSAFHGCFRGDFSTEFRDLLPRKGFEDNARISAHALFG